MNNRITQLMAADRTNLLSVFYTAGYPRLESTVTIARELEQAGADLLEIGIPFSDPIADGPVIQQSSKTAIENGMTVPILLDQVKQIRKEVQLPILLMGYVNPVLQYGMERFLSDAAAAGADGLIFPDLPLAEFESGLRERCAALNLSVVFLVAPATPAARVLKIDALSEGFIYAVSASSTTGAKAGFSEDQLNYFAALQRMNLKNPFLIGFGIADAQGFQTACRYARGAIIGSAFINMLGRSADLQTDIRRFILAIRDGGNEM
jgi:tryptophan synthase alpha chain